VLGLLGLAVITSGFLPVRPWAGQAGTGGVESARRGVRGPSMLNLFNRKESGTTTAKGKAFTITVKQKFYKDAELKVEGGDPVNLRKELLKNKIDMYPLQGKIYNCGGGGQCGTCAVQVLSGGQNLR
jgi:ferredoxin